jgi:hypothetical protein
MAISPPSSILTRRIAGRSQPRESSARPVDARARNAELLGAAVGATVPRRVRRRRGRQPAQSAGRQCRALHRRRRTRHGGRPIHTADHISRFFIGIRARRPPARGISPRAGKRTCRRADVRRGKTRAGVLVRLHKRTSATNLPRSQPRQTSPSVASRDSRRSSVMSSLIIQAAKAERCRPPSAPLSSRIRGTRFPLGCWPPSSLKPSPPEVGRPRPRLADGEMSRDEAPADARLYRRGYRFADFRRFGKCYGDDPPIVEDNPAARNSGAT